MASIKKCVILILFVFALTACQSPEEVSFKEVCQIANNEKYVIIDGYFSLGTSIYCSDVSGELRCGLVFNNYPEGDLDFSAEVKQGRRRNHMFPLESGYLEEDLQMKTSEGSMIGVGDHVKIAGELLVTEEVCLMYVESIETFDE